MKKRNILKYCFLPLLIAMLIPVFAYADMPMKPPLIYWNGLNPFHQPFSTTYYYGSGDINLDAVVNAADITAMQEIINSTRAASIMADVNGDSYFNTSDLNLLSNAVNNGGILPGWWNSLTDRQAKIEWLDKMLVIDKTNERFYKNNWQCVNFAGQLAINCTYSRWNLNRNFYTGGQTVYNIPMYTASIIAPNFGHNINAILVGDNPLNFGDWLFVEPQTDSHVVPGNYGMPEGSTVSIASIEKDLEGGYIGSNTAVQFHASSSGSTVQSYLPDLILTRPAVSAGTILNPTDRWSPGILKKGSGYLMFDQMRSDLTRITDIHITSLPYTASSTAASMINRDYSSRLLDSCVAPDGTTHVIWTGTYVEPGSTYNTGIYYGILDPATGVVSGKFRIAETRNVVVKGRILCAPDGTVHVLYNDFSNSSINWHTKTGGTWSSVTRVVQNIAYENAFSNIPDIRDPKQYFFDAEVTSDSLVKLAWIGIDSSTNRNTIYYKEYTPSTNTWETATALYSGIDTSKPAGLSLAWDGTGTHLAFWSGAGNFSQVIAEYYRGNIYVMSMYGCTWSSPSCLDNSGQATSVRITSDRNGESCIVWDRRIGTMSKPVYSIKSGTGRWESPIEVAVRSGAEAFYPEAAFTENNELYLCWSSRSTETMEIETYKIPSFSSSNPNSLKATRPVLYYDFDAGQATDMSGNNNTGTLGGAVVPSPVNAVKKQGLYFNGTSSITASDSDSLDFGTGDFSISCWVKTTAYSAKLVNKKSNSGVGFSLEIYNGVPLIQVNDPVNGFFNYYDTNITRINNNAWHLITVTMDRDSSTGAKIYVDGVLKVTKNALYRTGNLSNTGSLKIGTDTSGTNYTGSIDELRVYNRVLLAKEIQSLYSDYYSIMKLSFNGDLNDVSGNGNSAGSSFAIFTSGARGSNALNSNASSAVSVADSPTLDIGTKDFSVAFWIKKDGVSGYERIFEKEDYTDRKGFDVCIDDHGFVFNICNYSYDKTFYGLCNNSWHYMTFTVDRSSGNNKVKVYIDGVFIEEFQSPLFQTMDLSNALALSIGRDHLLGWQYTGILDELCIYGKALTANEVSALMSSGI